MKRAALIILALTMLAGCGIKGGLERPSPLWGEARERARQEERQRQGLPDTSDATDTMPNVPIEQGTANPLPQ